MLNSRSNPVQSVDTPGANDFTSPFNTFQVVECIIYRLIVSAQINQSERNIFTESMRIWTLAIRNKNKLMETETRICSHEITIEIGHIVL